MKGENRLVLAVLSLSLPVSLGAFSMDMLLPTMPDMAIGLQLTPAQIQWTLNVFVLGFAACQLLVGVAATRVRIHFLFVAAVGFYILSSAGIGMTSSYPLILLLRFVQALASCTTLIVSMALITQTFRDSDVTRGHSMLSGITSLGPLLAPVAGAAIVNLGGNWRSIFFALSLTGCVVLVLFLRRSRLFCWQSTGSTRLRSFGLLAESPYFWRYATYSSTGMCWIFIFFSLTPFIVCSVYARDAWALALVFLLASAFFLVGSYLGSRLHYRGRPGILFDWCIVVQFALTVVLLLASLAVTLPFYVFVGWIMLMQLNCGIYFGPAISTVLQKFPEIPVQAAAFQGFQQFMSTFVVSGILLILFEYTVINLSIMTLIITALSATIVLSIKKRKGIGNVI